MRTKLLVNEHVFFGKRSNELTAEVVAEEFYKIIAKCDHFQIELEDGSYLVLGREASANVILVIEP